MCRSWLFVLLNCLVSPYSHHHATHTFGHLFAGFLYSQLSRLPPLLLIMRFPHTYAVCAGSAKFCSTKKNGDKSSHCAEELRPRHIRENVMRITNRYLEQQQSPNVGGALEAIASCIMSHAQAKILLIVMVFFPTNSIKSKQKSFNISTLHFY